MPLFRNIAVQDEGVDQGSVGTFNFTGTGVVATVVGGVATVDVGSTAGASGSATIDFGAFPGSSEASVAVTGQAGILAGSVVLAWIRPVATALNTDDEHVVENVRFIARDIVPGTGFTIVGECTLGNYLFGTYNVNWRWS